MIELFLKLIEKCIELVKKRSELSAKEFSDFIEPLFDCFEKVHAEYVQAFGAYRKRILEGQESLSAIAASIESDVLLTAGQRIKTLELAKYSQSADSERLIEGMQVYLLDPAVSIMRSADGPYFASNQSFRRSLVRELRLIEEGTSDYIFEAFPQSHAARSDLERRKRELAADRLEEIAARMQQGYAKVVDAYAALRRKLLSPA